MSNTAVDIWYDCMHAFVVDVRPVVGRGVGRQVPSLNPGNEAGGKQERLISNRAVVAC
jgi:hypothetical protein